MRLPKPRWPKFSLVELLLLTGMVALAAAASAGTGQESPNFFEGALTLGSLLLAYQIAHHAILLARDPQLREPPWRAHRNFAILVRWTVVAGIVGVTLLTIVMNRTQAEIAHSTDYSALLTSLWPTLIHALLALAAAGLLLSPPRSSRRASLPTRWIAGTLVTLGLATFSSTYLFDLHTIMAIIHMATEGIEASQRGHWHRDAFPHHASENYRTYLASLAAMGLLALATTLLVASWRTPHPRRRRLFRWGFLFPLLGVGIFDVWYFWQEFPRISPDLASGPFPLTPWGIAGLILMVVGLALYGSQLAIRLHPLSASATTPIEIPLRWPASWGAILLFAAATKLLVGDVFEVDSYVNLVQALTELWESVLDVGVYVLHSDALVFVLLLPIAATLLWRSLRRRPLTLTPVPLTWPEVTFNTTATLLLVAVGAPCLHAFGFAMWLGPDWKFW